MQTRRKDDSRMMTFIAEPGPAVRVCKVNGGGEERAGEPVAWS